MAFRKTRINLGILFLIPRQAGVRVEIEPAAGTFAGGEWYAPPSVLAQDRPDRIILYFHGGGYAGGSPRSHRALVSRIAWASNARVFNAGYSLSTDRPWPAAVDNAEAAWKTVRDRYPDRPVFLSGDSAGGGLCLALLQRLRQQDSGAPTGLVLLAPWVDVRMTSAESEQIQEIDPMLCLDELRAYGKQYAGEEKTDHPEISPACYKPEHWMPPTYVQAGSADILFPDIRDWAESLRESGHPVELERFAGLMHVWQAAIFPPESKQAIRKIGAWIQANQ